MNPRQRRDALENLLDQLLRGIQRVLMSGEELSDEYQALLAQQLRETHEEITRLNQEIETEDNAPVPPEEPIEEPEIPEEPPQAPRPPGGNIPPLEPTPHESSNINAMRFDPEKQELFIKFQGKYPQQNGPVYSYQGVPPYIFDIIRRGAVAPKTSGRNAWHTWKEGVTPSHGASVNALLKAGGFAYARIQ